MSSSSPPTQRCTRCATLIKCEGAAMNYKMVGFVLGRIFLIEAALMLLSHRLRRQSTASGALCFPLPCGRR